MKLTDVLLSVGAEGTAGYITPLGACNNETSDLTSHPPVQVFPIDQVMEGIFAHGAMEALSRKHAD